MILSCNYWQIVRAHSFLDHVPRRDFSELVWGVLWGWVAVMVTALYREKPAPRSHWTPTTPRRFPAFRSVLPRASLERWSELSKAPETLMLCPLVLAHLGTGDMEGRYSEAAGAHAAPRHPKLQATLPVPPSPRRHRPTALHGTSPRNRCGSNYEK